MLKLYQTESCLHNLTLHKYEFVTYQQNNISCLMSKPVISVIRKMKKDNMENYLKKIFFYQIIY